MSDAQLQWERNNETYLTAALAWLRLRLLRLSQETAVHSQQPTSSADNQPFWRRRAEPETVEQFSIPAEDINTAFEAMMTAETADPPPALPILAERLGLSRFEQQILLLCAGLELDTRIALLCAQAQGDANRTYPTFALAMALFDEPIWDALSPERPLRYWQLLEINQPGSVPLTVSALRADERIVNYLKGLNYLDDRLTPLLAPFDVQNDDTLTLPPSQQETADHILHYLNNVLGTGLPPVLQCIGSDTLSKQLVIRHAARRLDIRLYRLPAELLPPQAGELETIARLWQREVNLLPIALYLDAEKIDFSTPASQEGFSPLPRFIARASGLLFVAVRENQPQLGHSSVTFEIAKPTPEEQYVTWTTLLNEADDSVAASLSGQFDLNTYTIDHIARAAKLEEVNDKKAVLNNLWQSCLQYTSPRLDLLSQRLEPKAKWPDIVLPEKQINLLHEIADQVIQRRKVYDEWGFRQKMNRGLGINALFTGESGTGKTMAAEVLANALKLNLYRIDLSAVVSKYIGETEKNLRRLFDAAEDGGAILFFDEADALFGKRSEVKDSHDRYANIEINYLLQRMEAYHGLAILATNMKNALDQAFLRRLRFIVDFPFPGRKERQRMWEQVFPADVPLNGVDFAHLAQLNLTGGSIHNVALNAAFLAARANEQVAMPFILAAARMEFQKMERPINEVQFHWQEKTA